jgi:tight adherence protein C
MNELLVGAAAFVAIVSIGGGVLLGYRSRRSQLQARLRAAPARAPSPGGERPVQRLVAAVGRLGTVVTRGRPSRTLAQYLAQAGYHSRSAPAVYLGSKVTVLVVALLASALLIVPSGIPIVLKWALVAAIGLMFFFVPNIVVAMRRKTHTGEVRRHLPDVIDLLEVCVSSGMSLDMAWLLVSDEIRDIAPRLADEMALTNLEVNLGAPRVAAMRHMAERTSATEVASLAAMLVQSQQFGTSVADALRTFAATLREQRSMLAQENAEKTAVKLLLPMALFLFPAVLVVIVGPAGMRLFKLLSGE